MEENLKSTCIRAAALSRSEYIALIAILALGGVLRAVAAWHYWNWFDGEFPGLWDASGTTLSQDATTYVQQAGVPGSANRIWAQLPFFRPPLASWYFAGLFPLLGFDRLGVAAVQTGLALLAYAAIFAVARRIIGTRPALLATLLTVLHPVLIFFDRSFEDSTLALLFTALAIASLQRLSELQRLPDAVLCGLLLSAAVSARSNLLLLVPLAVFWLYRSLRGTQSRNVPSTAEDHFSASISRLGMVACALIAVVVLVLTGIREHKIPIFGIALFAVARYEQMLLAFLLSAFAAYFGIVAYRSRLPFDGLIAAAIGAVAVILLPSTALLIGVVLVLYRLRRQSASSGPADTAFLQPPPMLIVALIFALASGLAPIAAHNWKAGGAATPFVSTFGQNLYWGNTPFAYHRITLEGNSGAAWLSPHEPTSVLIQGLKKRYPSRTSDEAMEKAAIAAMQADPMAAIERLLNKARRDLAGTEIARNENFADERVASPLFRLPIVPFALMLGLAACYVVLEGRFSEATILFLPWLVVLVSETIFFNASRYRSLAIPFLLPLAVAGALTLWQALQQRRNLAKATTMSALIAVLVVIGEFAVPEQEKRSTHATELFKMARMELYYVDHRKLAGLRPEHPQRMEARLNEALASDPDHLSAHYLMSMWQIDRGDVDGARARNAARASRCAADDWLCRDVCKRIAQVADAPAQYRAYVQEKIARTDKATAEFSKTFEWTERTEQ
jgi:hypothetical protein